MLNFNPGDIVKYTGSAFSSIFCMNGEVVEDPRGNYEYSTVPVLFEGVVFYLYPENITLIRPCGLKPASEKLQTVDITISKMDNRKFIFNCSCGFEAKHLSKNLISSFNYCPKCGGKIK